MAASRLHRQYKYFNYMQEIHLVLQHHAFTNEPSDHPLRFQHLGFVQQVSSSSYDACILLLIVFGTRALFNRPCLTACVMARQMSSYDACMYPPPHKASFNRPCLTACTEADPSDACMYPPPQQAMFDGVHGSRPVLFNYSAAGQAEPPPGLVRRRIHACVM